MDALLQTLKLAQTKLEAAGVRSAVIGGLAVAAWGRPRVTDDVDLKVSSTREDVEELIELLHPDFKPVADAVEVARSIGVLFLDGPGDTRLDLLLSDLGFDGHALDRAIDKEIVAGFSARICTAEDIVIYKLISTRPRDREDVRSIMTEQTDLDGDYVEHWLELFEQALDDSTLRATFREFKAPG